MTFRLPPEGIGPPLRTIFITMGKTAFFLFYGAGIAMGIAIGFAVHNLAVGAGVGVALGAALSRGYKQKRR